MDVLDNTKPEELEVAASPEMSDRPIVTVSAEGQVKFDAQFYARIKLTADFYFKYRVSGGNVDLVLKFYGYYEVAMRLDLTFQAVLKMQIQNLVQWKTMDQILWVGEAPILYHPFLNLSVAAETQPTPLFGAGIQLYVTQNFMVGYKHKSHWLGNCHDHLLAMMGIDPSACKDGYEVHDDYDHEFGEFHREMSISRTVGTDTNTATNQCPSALRNFGFDVKPILTVGAVFYELVALYAKPQPNFQFRLTMPQSDGPTCDEPEDYDMCTTAAMKASWSIDVDVIGTIGLKVESYHDLLDRIWNFVPESWHKKYINVPDWLLKEMEHDFEIAKFDLAGDCFTFPHILQEFYTPLCCGM